MANDKTSNAMIDRGWVDRGDGTVVDPSGSLGYDANTGEYFNSHSTDPWMNLTDSQRAEAGKDESKNPWSNYQEERRESLYGSSFTEDDKKVPIIHLAKDEEGNYLTDAQGNKAWEVVYSDGTKSFGGYGREGIAEAANQRSRVIQYNNYIDDDRTLEDFATAEEYNHFNIVKNIRIGQGQYSYTADRQGNATLKAPNGAVLSSGSLDDIRKEYGSKASTLAMAMRAVADTPNYTTNEKQYIMQTKGFSTDEQFNNFIREGLNKNYQKLNTIYSSWDQAATNQGITDTGSYYKIDMPDLTTFVPAVTQGVLGYQDWYNRNILGQASVEEEVTEDTVAADGGVEQTITGTEAGTTTGNNQAVGNTGGNQAVGNTGTATTTSGGFYQPLLQTPVATTTQTPGYQNVSGVYPTSGTNTTGTLQTPLTQTSQLSAIPDTVTTYPNYTGTTMSNLTSQSQQGYGGQIKYSNNQTGQILYVTVDANGNPMTYVPPGFVRADSYAEGGQVNDPMLEAKYRIATMNGYNGPKTNAALNTFGNSSPAMTAKFNAIGAGLAKGGYIPKGFADGGAVRGYNPGGSVESYEDEGTTKYKINYPTNENAYASEAEAQAKLDEYNTTTAENAERMANLSAMQTSAVSQTMQPTQAPVSYIQPEEADFVPLDAGQSTAIAPYAEAAKVENVTQAGVAQVAPTTVMTPATVTPQVQATTEGLSAVQGTLGTQAQVAAQQQTTSAVTGMQGAQGASTDVVAPAPRDLQTGELIDPVANAASAAAFTEQIQAATATPSAQATVQGQLEGLMQQFEGGETPAWAAGSMRTAMATLSARGLGASSLAGQAIIQATMEAALPIAQMDAQVQAQFEGQNLSNRQQRAMLSAEQRATFLGQEFDQAFQARVQNSARIGDIANMNFTAEQTIALENSRAANTMDLNNLSNRQALIIAEASALSGMDLTNLNNRQQAAVQNAQNFLQMDMANLSNEQQTAMFKSQQNVQALFTDQAAENAAAQFNASSENQTNQFFASMANQTSQFNAAQQNAMDQFNVNSVNALREFNSEIQQQRDLFNAQNGLVIAQSNAQWRQNLTTLNTAAQNQSNSDFAKTMNALTASNMDQIWQRERDLMSFAFAAAESSADRAANIAIAKLTAAEQAALQDNIGKGKLTAIAFDAVLGAWL